LRVLAVAARFLRIMVAGLVLAALVCVPVGRASAAAAAAVKAKGAASTQTAPAPIDVGIEPVDVAVDPTTGNAYVANYGSDTVSVIDESTNTVTATIDVGEYPEGVAFDSANGDVYVANFGTDTVSVIDGSTNTVTATIDVGVEPVEVDPYGVAVDPATDEIYVTNIMGDWPNETGTVSVIDGSTNTMTATIDVGSGPFGVAVDPATGDVYVTDCINTTCDEGAVLVIDGATNTVTATIDVGEDPESVAVDPTTGNVYVTNYGSGDQGTVSVIDGSTNAVTATIDVGEFPFGVAADPSTGDVYVTNFSGGTVSVIDESTNSVTATIDVGAGPKGVAVDPDAGNVYVANFGSDNVSVIDTCTEQDVTDGSFEVAGCLADGSGGNDYTDQESSIDGVDVTSSSGVVDYSTTSDDVTSTGASTVSLVLGDDTIPIFDGDLSGDSLAGSLSFEVAAYTQIAGMGISGTLTLTATSAGTASGSVSVTLPPALGGGTGTLTFDTSTDGGLSDLSVTASQANFMQLFSLTDLTLTYSAGTWTVDATASSGGSTSTTFSGTMTYLDGFLDTASLTVGDISVAGLFDIDSLTVTNNNGAWSGHAAITQTSGKTVSADVAMAFDDDGTLTSASIAHTGPLDLFGVLELSQFALSYSGSSWGLSWTTESGTSGSASLTTADGVISAASLTVSNIPFSYEGKTVLTVDTATVSYSEQAPNPACADVTGTEVWCGSWQVELPQATIVTGVSGAVAFAGGSFASAAVTVTGNVPLLYGIALTQLTASLTLNPPPGQIQGGATVTFGPPVASVPLFSLQGTLTRVFPSADTPGEYLAGGTLTALPGTSNALVLGTANVTDPDKGATTFTLALGPSPATGLTFTRLGVTVTVTGSLTGKFTASTFSITGQSQVTVSGAGTFTGSVKADNDGIASCAGTTAHKVGFEETWATGSVQLFGTKGCSEAGF
jgi:YVTN family beta-propeller protein